MKLRSMTSLKLVSDKIYRCKEVVEKEISGYQGFADLLDVFISAINNTYDGKATNYDKLLINLLPEKYQKVHDGIYQRILSVCSFIAGMSDSAAILLHKKIKGFEI